MLNFGWATLRHPHLHFKISPTLHSSHSASPCTVRSHQRPRSLRAAGSPRRYTSGRSSLTSAAQSPQGSRWRSAANLWPPLTSVASHQSPHNCTLISLLPQGLCSEEPCPIPPASLRPLLAAPPEAGCSQTSLTLGGPSYLSLKGASCLDLIWRLYAHPYYEAQARRQGRITVL